jgi:ParB-like chromosome segregation protein Spo0J
MKYKNHELADLFPMMSDSEISDMSKDIKANGQRNPIVMHEGKILDGRNRYAACVMADIDPIEVPFKGKDALSYVLSTNLHRRHLSTSQRAMVAEKLATMAHGGDRKSDQAANLPLEKVSQSDAAEKLNVSERSIRDAKAIREASNTLAKEVENGVKTLNAAKKEIKAQEEEMPFDPDIDVAKLNKESFKKSKIEDDFGAEIPKALHELWGKREQVKGWVGRLQEIRREIAKEWESRNKLLTGKKTRNPLSFNSVDASLASSITDIKAAYPRHLCPVCNGGGCDYCAGIGIVSDFFFKTIPETLQ